MLAFVGEANDGLPDRGCVPSLRMGMRLGVVGASPGTDVVGDVLRRFEGDESIVEMYGVIMSFHVLGGNCASNGCCGSHNTVVDPEVGFMVLSRIEIVGRDFEGRLLAAANGLRKPNLRVSLELYTYCLLCHLKYVDYFLSFKFQCIYFMSISNLIPRPLTVAVAEYAANADDVRGCRAIFFNINSLSSTITPPSFRNVSMNLQ